MPGVGVMPARAAAYGTINPAMRFYVDAGLGTTSEQAYDLEATRTLLADAGFPNGGGFPVPKILCTPAARCDCLVIRNLLTSTTRRTCR